MGKKVEFLYLCEEDMIKAGALNMQKCVDTVEEALRLYGMGDCVMGGPNGNEHGIMIYFPAQKRFPNMPVAGADRRFMAMISYVGGRFNVCGEKWYGSNVENPKRGLPRSIHFVILNDPVTSEPLAVMVGNLVSAMRTGAVPGVAAKYMARKDAETVGIIGAGVISRASLLSFGVVLKNLKEVKVFDIVSSQSEKYCKDMTEQLGISVHPVSSTEEAVRRSDVVSIAASGPIGPVIEKEWLKEGSLLAVSAKVKLGDDLLLDSRVFFDEYKMHRIWYADNEHLPQGNRQNLASFQLIKLVEEGKLKEEDIGNLGEVVLGTRSGRTNDREKTILFSFGMPIEDVAWGCEIYREALRQGIGQKLTLWNEPHWF